MLKATPAAPSVPDVPPDVEHVAACALCGDRASTPLGPSRDRFHALPGEFALVRCAGCGLVRLSPRPVREGIGFYYPPQYYDLFYPSSGAPEDGAREDGAAEDGAPEDGVASPRLLGLKRAVGRHLRAVVLDAAGYPDTGATPVHRALRPAVVPLYRRRVFFGFVGFPRWEGQGRALDVGCASGAFLACLRYYGWDVAGVDLDPEMAAAVRDRLGCEVFAGDIEHAPFPPGSFDFVHLRDVLEHTYDPVGFLRAAARLARPGGLVFVQTPNVEGTGVTQCGDRWYGWDTPRHLHLFSPSTLRRALAAAGLVEERMTTLPLRDLYRVEDTFLREEQGAPFSEPRFRLRARRAPRAAVLATRARLRRALHPLSGDVLACWARRPGH